MFERKKPLYMVVKIINETPLQFEVVKRCGWKVDANRYKREKAKETGEVLFTISTVEWL